MRKKGIINSNGNCFQLVCSTSTNQEDVKTLKFNPKCAWVKPKKHFVDISIKSFNGIPDYKSTVETNFLNKKIALKKSKIYTLKKELENLKKTSKTFINELFKIQLKNIN